MGNAATKRVHSVSFRLNLLCIVLVTGFLVGAEALNYIAAERDLLNGYWAQRRATEQRLAISLAGPVWSLDRPTIDSILRAELVDPVVRIVLYESDGSLIGGASRDGQSITSRGHRFVSEPKTLDTSDGDLRIDRPDGSHLLGRIVVTTTREGVLRVLRAELGRQAVEIAILDLLLVLALSIVFRKLAGDPLRALTGALLRAADATKMVSVHGADSVRLPEGRRDEFGDVSHGFNLVARRLAEELERRSEQRFGAIIENSSDAIVIARPDGTVIYRSPSCLEQLGYAAADVTPAGSAGESIFARMDAEGADRLASSLDSVTRTAGERAIGHCKILGTDNSWRVVAWTARNALKIPGINGIILNLRDITEMRRLDAQLQQAAKMEAIGNLAGGIAHDFNNILGSISAFAEFLSDDLGEGSPQQAYAQRIVASTKRAKGIVKQILTFSRQGAAERETGDLVPVVRETCELLRASLSSTIRLETAIEMEVAVAEFNADQVSQVLLNLGVNARDALDGKPGSILVRFDSLAPGDADYGTFLEGATAGSAAGQALRAITGMLDPTRRYARLTVTDSGCGMQPKVIERIFLPFFTTKERGKGTGFGLAVLHGIVTAHEGACLVTSRPGLGSTFTVYLPLAPQDFLCATSAQKLPQQATEQSTRARASVGGDPLPRILVVDDEHDICDALQIGLTRAGFDVVAVSDPREALAMFSRDSRRWDAIVSDEGMPHMPGHELCRSMKEISPAIRFVLCSGFSDFDTGEAMGKAGVDACLAKPVAIDELVRAIRSASRRRSTAETGKAPQQSALLVAAQGDQP